MEANEIYARIDLLRIVPVIAIENPEAALPLADALLEGGLPVAEITFTGPPPPLRLSRKSPGSGPACC